MFPRVARKSFPVFLSNFSARSPDGRARDGEQGKGRDEARHANFSANNVDSTIFLRRRGSRRKRRLSPRVTDTLHVSTCARRAQPQQRIRTHVLKILPNARRSRKFVRNSSGTNSIHAQPNTSHAVAALTRQEKAEVLRSPSTSEKPSPP